MGWSNRSVWDRRLVGASVLAVLVVPVAAIQMTSVNWSGASPTPPRIASLSRSTGPVVGGTKVTITGHGFNGATGVTFGSTPAQSFGATSTTQITAVAPAEAGGTVAITVTTSGGQSPATPADVFRYMYPVPRLTGAVPLDAPLSGGTTVTFTGSGLTGATRLNFGTLAVSPVSVNAAGTQLTVTTPGGAPPATVVFVSATTPGGTSNYVTFVFGPIVTSLSRTTGPATGGTKVTITGNLFTGVTRVRFWTGHGTDTARWTVNSPTSITAFAPAHAPGVVAVIVTTSANGETPPYSGSAAQFYTYV